MAEEKKAVEKKAEKKKEPGKIKKFFSFFREIKSELKKVVWPSPKQLLNNTLVVLVVVILSAVFIGVVDSLFKFIVGFLA